MSNTIDTNILAIAEVVDDRFVALESHQQEIVDLEPIETQLDSINDKITELESTHATLVDNINTAISNEVSAINTSISAIEQLNVTQSVDILANTGKINSNTALLGDVNTALTQIIGGEANPDYDALLEVVDTKLEELSISINQLTDYVAVSQQVMHVQDQKPQGTNGGTFTGGGVWRIRDLNTVLVNTIPGAFLANNHITLFEGTYDIFARAPFKAIWNARAGLCTADGIWLAVGGNSQSLVDATSNSFVTSRVVLNTATAIGLWHIGHSTRADVGFGYASDLYTEIYSEVFIRRIA